MANMTFVSKKQGSLEYPLINPSNRRKGVPVHCQCDNGECLQGPCMFNVTMRSVFRTMQEEWKKL